MASAHVLPSDVQIQKPPKLKYQQNQQKVIENQQKVIESQQKYDKTQQDVVENSKCNLKIKTRRTDGVERLYGINKLQGTSTDVQYVCLCVCPTRHWGEKKNLKKI